MEERKLKISFYKAGSGSMSGRLCIPMKWLKDMELTPESNEVEVIYDEKKKSFTARKASK